jgi:hypothetical protein
LHVDPGDQLVIPATPGRIGSPESGRLAAEEFPFNWPDVPVRPGGTIDYRTVVGRSHEPGYEMIYLTDLRAGWFAVLNPADRHGFGLAFDHDFFDTLWVFQSQGGWRGLHVVVIEPCNGFPCELGVAAAEGRCGRLEPGTSIETEVTAVIITGRDQIQHIGRDGEVS